jgi:uncharacterized protein YidB (DUF937 family)
LSRPSPLLSVLTGATRPGALVAPGPGAQASREGGILEGLPEPDLDKEGFDPEAEVPWEEEPVDTDEEEDWEEEEDPGAPAPKCDLWKIYQFGSKGPAWIHTEREQPVTEETLLSMFGPGTYRVIGHRKGREEYSTLVRIGVPAPAAVPSQVAQAPAESGQLGQLAATLQILDKFRPPAPQPVDPVELALRLSRLMRLGEGSRPAPLPPAEPAEVQPRGLDWPEAVLHLADLVAEKFPSVTGVKLQPAQVIEFLREPGVLEEVLGAAVQDPTIAGRILEYFRQPAEEPPTM